MDSRSFVRPFVRNAISCIRKPCIRFWWFFAQSYILMSLKNVPSGFLKKILVWPFLAKNGQFLPFLAIFSQKIGFLDIFFESAYQICLKLGQKLGTVALNHRMAVLCLGKFSFWLFWPFLGQKYIACGDIIWFLAEKLPFEPISSKPRIRFWWFFHRC